MIITNIENAYNQIALTPYLKKAFRFLQMTDLDNLPEGKHLIDDENVFALVSSYTTNEVGRMITMEGHLHYLDIQYLVVGQEAIAWAPIENVPVSTPYQEEFDFWEGELPAAEVSLIKLSGGMFAVLFPHDAHAPQLAAGKPMTVRKIVVKVTCEDAPA